MLLYSVMEAPMAPLLRRHFPGETYLASEPVLTIFEATGVWSAVTFQLHAPHLADCKSQIDKPPNYLTY